MIDYVDPIPAVVRVLNAVFQERVYGNTFPDSPAMPSILVRSTGGTDYTRLQLLTRGTTDMEAMGLLIRATNELMRNSSNIGLQGVWIERESNPISAVDEDTGRPEAWCYLRMEHLEA